MSTIQSQVDQIRSIKWQTAIRAVVEFFGRIALILSLTMIYALFIAVVSEVVPLEEFSHAGLRTVEFGLGVPPLAVAAFAAARVANYIADTDISEQRVALLAVGVALFAHGIHLNLIDLGVV